MKKRIISLLLVLTLCVGMLPAPAWAEEEPTEPTQAVEEVKEPTTEPTEEETTEAAEEPSTEAAEEETTGATEETEPTEEETEPTEVQMLEETVGEAAVFAAEGAEDVAMLEANGKTTYYASVNEAIDAATAAKTGTVTLLDDAALENSDGESYFNRTNKGTDLTIVLDGHTLSGNMEDGSWDAQLTIDGAKSGSAFSGYIKFYGKRNVLTISGGTYQNDAGDCVLEFWGSSMQLNITAGEFKNRLQFSCSWDSENGGYTPLNVTGGTFNGITYDGNETLTLCRKSPYCFTEDGQKVKLSDLALTTDKTLTVERCTDHIYDESQLDCIYCGQRNPTQAPADTVATVDGQFYSDILKAIQAANTNGMPVVLFDDCRLPDGFGLQLDGYTVTVDLNGQNLIVEPGSPLQVLSGDVTLMNSQTTGKITVGGNSGSAIQVQGGSLTVKENVQVEGVSYGGHTYPAIVVNDGTVTLHQGAALVNGIQAQEGHTIAEYLAAGSAYAVNGQVTNGYVQETTDTLTVVPHERHIFGTGTQCSCGFTCDHGGENYSSVDLETGACKDCGGQIYVAKIGTEYYTNLMDALADSSADKKVTVLADTSLSGTSGVYILTNPAWLDLNGKTVKGYYFSFCDPLTVEGPGEFQAALTINSEVTLKGAITAQQLTEINDDGKLIIHSDVTMAEVTVQGGHLELLGGSIGKLTVTEGQVTLRSGTLRDGLDLKDGSNILSILAEGKALKRADGSFVDGAASHAEGTLEVVDHSSHDYGTTGKCGCGALATASVSADASVTYFADFPDAVTAAQSAPGSTVTLLQDVTLTGDNNIYIDSGTFTVDWQGHTLSGKTWKDILVITKTANVTLTDSIGTGGVRNTGGSAVGINVDSNGSLTVQGGTYSPQVYKYQNAYGHIQISGGVFESVRGSGKTCALYCDTGVLADLLAPGYTLAYQDDDALFDVYQAKMTDAYRSVYVVEHPTHELDDDTDTCVCGFHCEHTDIDADGKCNACGNQMAASVTAGDGSVTYYRNIADAIAAATAVSGTTVTLLDDINETIANDGQNFTLDLNGKTLAKLELTGGSFTLLDSQQTGSISELQTDKMICAYLKEGWCLVRSGSCLEPAEAVDDMGPFQVEFSGVKNIVWPKKASVSYGWQKFPCGLGFDLEDPAEVVSAQLDWSFADAPRDAIGPTDNMAKENKGGYSSTSSGNLTTNLLDFDRLIPGNTYGILATVTLTRKDGSIRKFAVSTELGVDKSYLDRAEVTLDSTTRTFSPNPQTAVGQEQTATVVSVVLGSKTLVEGTDYEVTGNTGTNAGTYTLTVKAKEDSAYYTGSRNVTWEIKPLEISGLGFDGLSKTYDGTTQAKLTGIYFLDGTRNIRGVAEGKDYRVLRVGDFASADVHSDDLLTVEVELLSGNYLYNGTNRGEFSALASIEPAEAPAPAVGSFTIGNGSEATYTMEDLGSWLTEPEEPCTYGTVTLGTPVVDIKAEGYAMTARIENGNLKLNVTGTGDVEGQVAVVTVPVTTQNYGIINLTVYVGAKDRIVPEVEANVSEIVYGQKLEESRVTSYKAYEPDGMTPIPGTFRWEEPETMPGAGTHRLKMIFTPKNTSQYAETSAWVAVRVNKRPVTLSGVTVEDKFYDGTTEAAIKDKGTFSNVVPGDTMDYTVTATFADKNVVRDEKNAVISKTAALTVSLTGDAAKNYTLTEDSQTTAIAKINPRAVTVTGGLSAQDRDYAPDNISVRIIKGKVTFDKKVDGDDLDVLVNGGSVGTADAGQNRTVAYSVTFIGADKDNYTRLRIPTLTVTIRPIPQTLSFAETTVTRTYGDAPFANALTHSAGDGPITYTSSDPAVATVGTDGTVTICGAGTAKITATAAATQNYVETSTSFDLTVAKAAGTVKNRDYGLTYFYGYIRMPKASDFTADSTGDFHFDWTQDGKTVTPRDAGTYTLTVTVDGDENYGPASLVLTVTVNKTSNIGKAVDSVQSETVFGKNDGLVKLFAPAENCEYRVKGETDYRDIPGDPQGRTLSLDVGTYEFRLKETKNYNPTPAENVTIAAGRKLTVTLPSPQTGYTLEASEQELSWHDSLKLTLTVADGYYKTASFAVKAGDQVLTEDNGTYTLTNVEDDVVIALEGVEKDETAPSLTLWNWIFGQGAFQGMASRKDWKNISASTAPYYVLSTRGNYFTVEASDGETGLGSVCYLLSNTVLTREALEKATWEPVPEGSLNPTGAPVREQMIQLGLGEWYFYVKAVDKAGNVSYVGSDRLIREENAPVFSGVTEGATYYTTQKVTVTDDYALSRYLAPGSGIWEDISGTAYEVTLEGNREAAYTVTAEDACQNTSALTVRMKPISALTEEIQDLTDDNIQMADDAKLTRVENALKGLDITYATDEEKKEISGALDHIAKLKAFLEEVDRVGKAIDALPESVEPWDAEAEKAVKKARSGYDALSPKQRELVGEDRLNKLLNLINQLIAYRFTSGENQTWALGSGKDLLFSVNGQSRKVNAIEFDGNWLDQADYTYTAQAKGTDFVLKASYLQGLKTGKHTLQVYFEDGHTPVTNLTVTVSPNYLDLSAYPEFGNDETVTVDGRTYPIGTDGGRYVNLPETGDILQRFTYLDGSYSAAHENYPVGMTTYRIRRQEGGAVLERIDALDDLLTYAGCSIRVSGKQGIRMITGISEANKKALTSKAGLSGYTLEEYGTLICWNTDVSSGDDFSLDMSCARSNYAYKKGKADPVFARQDGRVLYTNVLVGFSLEDCAKDLVLRPYIILKDTVTGETVTLYGGSVCRSIGYIAWQNRDTYKPGTSGYKYVHNILQATGQEP